MQKDDADVMNLSSARKQLSSLHCARACKALGGGRGAAAERTPDKKVKRERDTRMTLGTNIVLL